MKLNFAAVLFNLQFYYQNLSNDIWETFVTENLIILSNTNAEMKCLYIEWVAHGLKVSISEPINTNVNCFF